MTKWVEINIIVAYIKVQGEKRKNHAPFGVGSIRKDQQNRLRKSRVSSIQHEVPYKSLENSLLPPAHTSSYSKRIRKTRIHLNIQPAKPIFVQS